MMRLLFSLLFFIPAAVFAQNDVDMADSFRADGKIYVVVAVIAIILSGITFYLFRTGQKLDKIEKALGK